MAALLAGPEPVQYMVEAFKSRRERFLTALRSAHKLHVDTPPGAFYAYVDVRAYLDDRYPTSNDLVMYLLEHGVAGVPGEALLPEDTDGAEANSTEAENSKTISSSQNQLLKGMVQEVSQFL